MATMPAPRRGVRPYINVAFRADPEMVERLDRILTEVNSKLKGPPWTRADLIRAMLEREIKNYPEKDPFNP